MKAGSLGMGIEQKSTFFLCSSLEILADVNCPSSSARGDISSPNGSYKTGSMAV